MGTRIIRSGAYQIVNEINGKSYVGSSKDINNRWSNWKRAFKKPMKHKSLIWSAVQKYNIENFTFIILEECEAIKDALLEKEQYYIDTIKPEYNILLIAGSRLGSTGKHSEETIEKIRLAHSTDEVKQVHRDYQTQKMADPENRRKISDAMTGVPKNYITHTTGTHLSEKTRQNISIGNKNSDKRKAAADRQKGKTTALSSSGEYGIQWNSRSNKWCVRINENKYGLFKTIDEAISKRNEIVALPPEERKTADMKLPSSGERNVIWDARKQKYMVRIGIKVYGLFASINDAVKQRDYILSLPEEERASKQRLSSGEYNIIKNGDRWLVKIDNKNFGSYINVDDAIIKRNKILALPSEERIVEIPLPSTGIRNISLIKNRYRVRIKEKEYGYFVKIEDAIIRRNEIMNTI
jgi:group I intron endonuclease